MIPFRVPIRARLIAAFLLVGLLPLSAAVLAPLWISSSFSTRQAIARVNQARARLDQVVADIRAKCRTLGIEVTSDPEFQELFHEGGWARGRGERGPAPWLLFAEQKAAEKGLNAFELSPAEYAQWRRVTGDTERLVVYQRRGFSSGAGFCGEAVPCGGDGRAILFAAKIWDEQPRDDNAEYSSALLDKLAAGSEVNARLIGENARQFREVRASLLPEAARKLFIDGERLHDDQAQVNYTTSHLLLIPVWDLDNTVAALIMFWLPQDRVVAMWNHIQYTLLWGMIGAAALAVLLGVTVSRSFSRPIRALHQQVGRLSRGDLELCVNVTSKDELGELAAAFNDMTRRLKATMAELLQRNQTIEEQNRHLDRTVRALEVTRAFVESVLAQVRSGVLTVDQRGRVTTLNPVAARLLGVPPPPAKREDGDQDGFAGADLLADQRLLAWIERVRQGNPSIEHREIDLVRADGGTTPVEVTITPLRIEADGALDGVVVTFVDLSSIKALQESLRRQERMAALGQLTAGVAHEIRNPLGIIKGSAELLKRKLGGQTVESGLIDDIIEETVRLSRTITDFLAFARPGEPRRAAVDLNALIRRVIEQLPLAESQAACRYRLDLDPALPAAWVDADQVRQVLLNLLLNAREAMPQGGEIVVRSRGADAAWVCVEVLDQGPGIAPDKQEQIFNPFYTTKSFGTGLGLSMVHTIVSQHGGNIQVANRPEGGCVFRVTLPRADAEGALQAARAAANQETAS